MSVVVPAYYAHLAAFRGRAMLSHHSDSDVESSISGASGATRYVRTRLALFLYL